MIDWGRVKELRDEVGPEDFSEVVELFLEEVEEVIARMKATPDPTIFEEDLHFLKGSALNLGFSHFADLCQSGEKAALGGWAETINMQVIFDSYTASKTRFLEKNSPLVAA